MPKQGLHDAIRQSNAAHLCGKAALRVSACTAYVALSLHRLSRAGCGVLSCLVHWPVYNSCDIGNSFSGGRNTGSSHPTLPVACWNLFYDFLSAKGTLQVRQTAIDFIKRECLKSRQQLAHPLKQAMLDQ